MKKNIIIGILGAAILVLIFAATPVGYTRLVSQLTVQERLTTGAIDEVVKHSQLNEVVTFQPSSDSVVTDVDTVYSAELTSGTTIDLTSLTNTLGNSMDLTGHRVMAIKLKNSSTTGSDAITVDSTATNGYPLMGSAYSFDLKPRQSVLFKCDTMLSNVSGTAKNIEYALNGDTLSVLLISARLY